MVSISVESVGLVYRVHKHLSLARPDRRLQNGDRRIVQAGRGVHLVTALDDVSFSLRAGDRLGLVGSNGSGKTSLLKILGGIFDPTSGTVAINGRADALFNIHLGFRPEATGRRNIELRGLINGWSKREIERRSEQIIEFSELGDFIDMPFKTYSQGMAARLAVSIATTLEPEILLMDEWIGAGDPEFQAKISKKMDELAERAGIIVIASHNLALLQRLCNKILHLDRGRTKSFLPAEEWFGRNRAAQ